MRKAWTLAAASLLLAGLAGGAESWVEVRSPNFAVVSNAGEGTARQTAWEFEQVRAAYARLWPWAKLAGGRATVVLALKDEKSLAQWAPEYFEAKGGIRIVSVSTHGADTDYLLLRPGVRTDSPAVVANYNLYRAYLSSLLAVSLERPLPVWLSNGLAAVFGNTSVRDDEVQVGRPVPWHLQRFNDRVQGSPAGLAGGPARLRPGAEGRPARGLRRRLLGAGALPDLRRQRRAHGPARPLHPPVAGGPAPGPRPGRGAGRPGGAREAAARLRLALDPALRPPAGRRGHRPRPGRPCSAWRPPRWRACRPPCTSPWAGPTTPRRPCCGPGRRTPARPPATTPRACWPTARASASAPRRPSAGPPSWARPGPTAGTGRLGSPGPRRPMRPRWPACASGWRRPPS